jgi:lipopolysaccharide export system permease protein
MTSFILQRYLGLEILKNTIIVFLVLGIIALVTQLSSLLKDIDSNVFSSSYLVDLIYLLSINQLILIIPISFLLGSIFALGKFNRDSELIIFMFSGFTRASQYRVFLFLALFFSFAVGTVSIKLGPQNLRLVEEIELDYARQGSCCTIPEAEFLSISEMNGVIYAERSNDGISSGIFTYYETSNGLPIYAFSETAQWLQAPNQGSIFIMANGTRYEGNPGDLEFTITTFEEQQIFIPYVNKDEALLRLDHQTFSQLIEVYNRDVYAELFYRISPVVMVIILTLYPLVLVNLNPRLGMYSSMFPALIIFLLYVNLVIYFRNLIITSEISIWLLVLSPHLLFLFLPLIIGSIKKRLT